MRLSIHLFDDRVAAFEDLVRLEDGTSTSGWLEPAKPLSVECRLLIRVNSSSKPDYLAYLEPHFLIEPLVATSRSVVLALKVEGRFFAITFGHGRHLLRRDRLVYDFGIKVTANSVDEKDLRAAHCQSLNSRPRRTQQYLAIRGSIFEFGVDLHEEWIYSLAGQSDDEIARGMSGSQALHVELKSEVQEISALPNVLRALLDRYRSTSYQERFAFLDALRPLSESDPLVRQLESKLVTLLREGTSPEVEKIGVMAPVGSADVDLDGPVGYRISGDVRGRRPYVPDLLAIRNVLRRAPNPLCLSVRAVDADGRRYGSWQVRDLLNAEISDGDGVFVLAAGRWFAVQSDHLEKIHARVAEVVVDYGELGLPDWDDRHGEPEYNLSAQNNRRRHMDKDMFSAPGARGTIEKCDLLDDGMNLIHVKRMRSSAALSHLFAQGSVSATLYEDRLDYRTVVNDAFRDSWPALDPPTVPRVVFAVGSRRDVPTVDLLPFFSKINLITHVRRIRACRMDVALVRIPIRWMPTQRSPSVDATQVDATESTSTGGLTLF